MSTAMSTRSIYVRHTDTKGSAYVSEHFVWDADRFMASRQQAAQAVNEDQKPGLPRLAKVEQITHNQYLKAKQ